MRLKISGLKTVRTTLKYAKFHITFLTVATIWAAMLTKRIWAPKTLRISKWAINY